MGTPRKYKDTLALALDAERLLYASKFGNEIKEIVLSDQFLQIPANDRAKLLKLIGQIVLYRTSDITASEKLLKRSTIQQKKHIAKLSHNKYEISLKRRSNKPTKKEKALTQEIACAKEELYKTMLLRAEIILMGGKPGNISHCRNIISQVLDILIEELDLTPEKSIKKDKKYYRKSINAVKEVVANYKDLPWEYQYIFAYCLYVYALTFKYAPGNTLDLVMQEFLDFISGVELSQGKQHTPYWVVELTHQAWAWKEIQRARRGEYSEAAKELLKLQSVTPFWWVYLRAAVQYAFIQAFKLGNLNEANDCLDHLKIYDMTPDLKLIWLMTKVYCQKKLGKQSETDYKSNVIQLNNIISKYRNYPGSNSKSLLIEAFHKEIGELKNFPALA
ncbi:MAG: hypothetical protein ACM3KR_11415 [Deltaproteobacteria bacterium]